MRHRIVGVAAALLGIGAVQPAHAEIPVIDFSSIAQEVKQYTLDTQEWATQNLQWAKQLQQYAMQAQQYATEAEQLAAFVHNPTLGAAMGLLNQAGLSNSLPVSPYSVLGVVNGVGSIGAGGGFNLGQISGVLGTLSGLAGTSYSANHVYSPTDNSWASQQLIANGAGIAGTQGAAMAAYQDLRTHASALQPLRDRLASAATPKDVQDAQAQIELETTWTANEAAQINAIQAIAQTQDQARAQRDNEAFDRDWDQFLSAAKAAGRTFN